MSAISNAAFSALGLTIAVSAAAQSRLLSLVGNPGEGFGYDTHWAGDVNGDGHDDLWILSPGFRTSSQYGRLALHSGRDGAALREFFGTVNFYLYGPFIVCGDVDADGIRDIVIGDINNGFGRCSVLSGASGTLRYARSGTLRSDFGSRLTHLGDIDGDGAGDFAVGAPGGPSSYGRVYVWSGRAGALIREHVGPNLGDYYGSGLAAVGDIDGDGVADLGIGTGVWGGTAVGFVHVMSGRTGTLLLSVSEAPATETFGTRFAGIGDVDQDGRGDLAIGKSGRFDIVRGRDGSLIRSHPFLQTAIAGGHDFDYDAVPDYLSSERDPLNANNPGTVRIFSGRTGAIVTVLRGEQPGDFLGTYIRLGGDINRDGRSEIAMGNHNARQTAGYLSIYGRVPGSFQRFGTGCAGTAGLPTIGIAAPPRIGTTVTLSVTNVRALQPGILLFGTSDTSWGSQPLPAPLDGYGMPGCTLWISPDSIESLSTALGTARWSSPIPNRVELLGARFFNQFLLLDPGVNALGVVSSDASVTEIGG